MKWNEFWTKLARQYPPERLLALDPGMTTGWALFFNGDLNDCGHVTAESDTDAIVQLHHMIQTVGPDQIVCEDYRVYASKAQTHVNSDLPVARIIGGVILSAQLLMTPIVPTLQTASKAKGFCTTAKLKEWGLYHSNRRHAMDAIRHGCYYILFARSN